MNHIAKVLERRSRDALPFRIDAEPVLLLELRAILAALFVASGVPVLKVQHGLVNLLLKLMELLLPLNDTGELGGDQARIVRR